MYQYFSEKGGQYKTSVCFIFSIYYFTKALALDFSVHWFFPWVLGNCTLRCPSCFLATQVMFGSFMVLTLTQLQSYACFI